MSGLRFPGSGVMRLQGYDQYGLPPEVWRSRIGAVPQFHENHILAAPLMFNLMLGRAWPPARHDIMAAQELCEALGLGPLLEKMPSGLNQPVGDSGWQLSHGERTRVFVVRSLMQPLDMRVLDESLAALDPITAHIVMDAILERAETLAVIAHA